MVLMVRQMNTKMDTVKGRLEGIKVRIDNVAQADLGGGQGMQDTLANAMLDFDRDM